MSIMLVSMGGCSPGTADGSIPGLAGSTSVGGEGESGVQPPAGDGSTSTTIPDSGSDGPGETTDAGTTSGGSTADPVLDECTFESTAYGQALQELDVPTGSTTRLSFTVPGLPDPALLVSATLRFDSYDADHPGEEGLVYVAGKGPFDLPADVAWDNAAGSGTIDVTDAVEEGTVSVEFGAGSLVPRSFFSVGNVAIDVVAYLEECDPAPKTPPADLEPRQVGYRDATFTQRHNWVSRCDDYLYTAGNPKHIPEDCDGLFDPDGSRRGTATFSFDDVAAGTYEVQIRSRHTENRNSQGALFVVDGVPKRVNQRDDANYTTDIWGEAELAGDVTVVLDSAQEGESDSVIWVRLEPL